MKSQSSEKPSDEILSTVDYRPSYQDDEIDLKELVVALWQGKFTIIISTVMCTALAIYYALSAVEKWTAEAVVSEPQVNSFSSYQRMVNDYQPIFDVYLEGGSVIASAKLSDFIVPENLFQIFVQEFQSKQNKKDFFSSYPIFQDEQKLLSFDENSVDMKKARAALYSAWYAKLVSTRNKDMTYTFEAIEINAEKSYELLNEYILYVSNKARIVAIENLSATIESKYSELNQQKVLFTEQAKNRLENELLQTRYALQIATAAGINAPQQNLNNNIDELFYINIGSNALQAKVDVLNKLTELSVIEPRLQHIDSKLNLLDSLKINPDIEFDTYQFIEPPQEPLGRTAPKRPLIAILGVLLGGMLGCGIVLIRFAFRKKDTV